MAGILSSITHYIMHNDQQQQQRQQNEEREYSFVNTDRNQVQGIETHNRPFRPNIYKPTKLYPNIKKISIQRF